MDSATKEIVKADIIKMINIYINAACKTSQIEIIDHLDNCGLRYGICNYLDNLVIESCLYIDKKIDEYLDIIDKCYISYTPNYTFRANLDIVKLSINPRIEVLHNILKELDKIK